MICRIRPYRADDAQALYEAARESVRDMFPWLAWCHPGYSMAEAVEWASLQAARAADSPEFVFAVVGPNDEFLGGCGVNQVNSVHRFAIWATGFGAPPPVEAWRARPFARRRSSCFKTRT